MQPQRKLLVQISPSRASVRDAGNNCRSWHWLIAGVRRLIKSWHHWGRVNRRPPMRHVRSTTVWLPCLIPFEAHRFKVLSDTSFPFLFPKKTDASASGKLSDMRGILPLVRLFARVELKLFCLLYKGVYDSTEKQVVESQWLSNYLALLKNFLELWYKLTLKGE